MDRRPRWDRWLMTAGVAVLACSLALSNSVGASTLLGGLLMAAGGFLHPKSLWVRIGGGSWVLAILLVGLVSASRRSELGNKLIGMSFSEAILSLWVAVIIVGAGTVLTLVGLVREYLGSRSTQS